MRRFLAASWPRALAGLVAAAYLEGVRALAGTTFDPGRAGLVWLFVQSVLEVALWVDLAQPRRGPRRLSWRIVAVLGFWIGATVVYVLTAHTLAAWVMAGATYVVIVIASSACQHRHWAIRLLSWAAWAGIGGLYPVLIGQIESRFAEEEFFVALQAVFLGGFAGLMILVHLAVAGILGKDKSIHPQARTGLSLPRWTAIASGLVVGIAGAWGIVWAYQHSFYTAPVPMYPGISGENPFICGQGLADGDTPGGKETFERLLARLASDPRSAAPAYGMLALSTGERRWTEAYRRAVLDDAEHGRYTGPAHSVKYGQYLAAHQAYYFVRVGNTFPNLFSRAESTIIRDWLAAVNRRTLTVEWVDWLYALAFSYWPEGPYENQENGAGLLALLEAHGLGDSSLSERNQDYLARNRRGWFERFRNTDDAYIYQPEWIDNALFQSEYWHADGQIPPDLAQNRALAFEWLLIQALPDGAPLGYNHPARPVLAQVAYLGAALLEDPRYVWWSARMLDWAEDKGLSLAPQPGVERPVRLAGVSPDVGSCLVYGDSGLPTWQGPLAPDKIVFRDGWTPDSRYLLLNLRFSGWHRYKATNTATLLYDRGPLAAEQDLGEPLSWLPVGRSAFRDKRIPRENLNGLLISRTGVSSVLYSLTGLGGPWAQDPPHYARVERFGTLGPLDVSRTVIDDWRGVKHARDVYFWHDGPIIFVDTATSDHNARSMGNSWHLRGLGTRTGDSLWLRQGENPVRIVWPADTWNSIEVEHRATLSADKPNLKLLYRSPCRNCLNLATVWLFDDWADSEYQIETLQEPGSDFVLGYHISLSGSKGTLEVLHNSTLGWLTSKSLATDGQAVTVWHGGQKESVVCAMGSNITRVEWPARPQQVLTLEGEALSLGQEWEWQENSLMIQNVGDAWCVTVN